jgi:hypothetical protein
MVAITTFAHAASAVALEFDRLACQRGEAAALDCVRVPAAGTGVGGNEASSAGHPVRLS